MNKGEIKQAYLNSADKNDRFILKKEMRTLNTCEKASTSTLGTCCYKIYLKRNFPQIIGYVFTATAKVNESENKCKFLREVYKILDAKTDLNAYYKYLEFVKSLTPELEDKYLAEFYLIKANSIIWVKKMIRKQKRYICKLKKKS